MLKTVFLGGFFMLLIGSFFLFSNIISFFDIKKYLCLSRFCLFTERFQFLNQVIDLCF